MNNFNNIHYSQQNLSFLQTNAWAEINKMFNNAECIEIKNSDDKNIFGLFFRKCSNPLYKKTIKKLIGIPTGILECHNGPVFGEEATKQDCEHFFRNLLYVVKRENIERIYITTNTFSPSSKIKLFIEAATKYGFKVKKYYNPVVDLRPSHEEISMTFKNSARTGARKAIQMGIKTNRCLTFEEYYYNFVFYSTQVKKLKLNTIKKYKKFWNNFAQFYNFFYTTLGKDVISLLGTYENNGIATPISSCITEKGLQLKAPAQDLLFWETIKYHKNKGNKFFDLTCISLNDDELTEKEKRIRSFKLKWSRTLIEQYVLELNINQLY